MKTTVNFTDFTDGFNAIRPDNFTYAGLRALYDYIEGYEEDCETEIELDVIALCCEYTEYANLDEYRENYGDTEDMEAVESNTMVIYVDDPPKRHDEEYDGRFIVQNW